MTDSNRRPYPCKPVPGVWVAAWPYRALTDASSSKNVEYIQPIVDNPSTCGFDGENMLCSWIGTTINDMD